MSFPDTLVLGATGRIGRVLQQCWETGSQRQPVLWQGRAAADLRPDLPQVILDPISDPVALTAAAAGRQILCLAGGVPGRGDLADNWRLAAAALAAAEPGTRVILCSSAAVYGNQPGPLQEALPAQPVSAYGRAKLEMEQRGAALAAERGVQLCLLRIGNIAGLDAILGGWQPGFQLDRLGDGSTPQRSYIGVATLARVLADLLALPQLPQVMNIAQPGGISMAALLAAADLDWRPRPPAKNVIARVILDTTILHGLIRIPPADPLCLVREWHCLLPHVAPGHSRE